MLIASIQCFGDGLGQSCKSCLEGFARRFYTMPLPSLRFSA